MITGRSREMTKRKLLSACLILILISIMGVGTLAFFTDEEKADNIITSGNIDIQLNEWTGEIDGEGNKILFEDVKGVMPGVTVPKIVEVENIGDNEAYVRISAEKIITLAQEGEADLDLITMDFDLENWTYKDGFYYYNEVLKPGEVTKPLFTGVTFDPTMDNLYQGCEVKIDVKADATQVANNGTSALDAKGWPEA